eukprot:g8782.t1
MDPYKLVGFEEFEIRTKQDLERVRVRVKKKWKSLCGEAQKLSEAGKKSEADRVKYDAAKLNEAFETVKQRFHKPPEQLIGRGRKERELDGFFNHQSKELRRNQAEIEKIRQKETERRRFQITSANLGRGGGGGGGPGRYQVGGSSSSSRGGRGAMGRRAMSRKEVKQQYLKMKEEKLKTMPTVENKPVDAVDMLKRVP